VTGAVSVVTTPSILVAVNVYVVIVADPTVLGGFVDIVPALDRFV